MTEPEVRKPRGFATLDPEAMRAIAAMGGRAVKAKDRSFSQNRALATQAGRKGGSSVPAHKRTYARDPAFATECGRKGGQSVPAKNRAFSIDPDLASRAGRKGGLASHGQRHGPTLDELLGVLGQDVVEPLP